MKQSQALNVMKLGHNVFLTGEPGSGKTYTLNRFIDYARDNGIGIGVTASTGIAATHLGGMTVHSWSGIGIHDEMDEDQLQRLSTRAQLKSRFKRTRVLIIDEVSMMDGKRLDLLDQVCRQMKNSDKPFGGLQVILCGDLFQLPPVTKYGQSVDFAHTSEAWSGLNLKVCYLSEQHRQDEDATMLELLRAIRSGEVDDDIRELLQRRMEEVAEDPDMTRLYSHNVDVDTLNARRLSELDAEVHTYTMQASGNKQFVEALRKSCLAPEVLDLKVGAQVICLANNPASGFINGSRAEVVDFNHGKPVIRLLSGRTITLERHAWKIEDNERTLAEVSQYPLRLAWAITVHKSQGMSLDSAEIDLSRAFTPGMGYVALSRLRRLDGLFLRGANRTALQINPEIAEFDAALKRQARQVVAQLEVMDEDTLGGLHNHIRTNLASDYAEYDKELFQQLREWRGQRSQSQGIPPYMVFNDKTLIALAAECPSTSEQLLAVPGIGPKKAQQYADEVLEIINRHSGKLF